MQKIAEKGSVIVK